MRAYDIHRFPDIEALAAAVAERVVALTASSQAERGACRWALAGGSTPRRLYTLLAEPTWSKRVDWDRVQLYWGDERCVPPEDPASNYRMARETLIDRVSIVAENVHRMRGELPPEEAAAEYRRRLGAEPLDVILLGMGADGHTASLFPDDPSWREEGRVVLATRSPQPPHERISLSLATIRAARAVLMLVTGGDKAPRVAQVLAQTESAGELAPGRRPELADARLLPAAAVAPTNGRLDWYLDHAAAAEWKR